VNISSVRLSLEAAHAQLVTKLLCETRTSSRTSNKYIFLEIRAYLGFQSTLILWISSRFVCRTLSNIPLIFRPTQLFVFT